MRYISIILLFFFSTAIFAGEKNLKPRLVVMTDIGDCDVEPDDMESAVRLLSYADMFEIEGIFTTVGWNCDPYPEEWADYLFKVVDAYGQDVQNLRKRSNQKSFLPIEKENDRQQIGYWPSVEYIRSRCMAGSHRAGIGVIGPDNNTVGSEFLIKLADEDDDRPIWVATWGSGNTLAQAIWKVKQTRSKEELKKFVNKFRIYTITDQDMKWDMRMNRAYSAHQWLRHVFVGDLKFIWDEGTWTEQCNLGKEYWQQTKQNIQGKGHLGSVYPNYKWGVEGDTPSFLYIIPNSLANPEEPVQVGWAGCHAFGLCPDSLTYAWTSWEEPQKSITEGYIRRFYPDELNDFCARIQWAATGQGNTNPIVYVNGQHSLLPLTIDATPGETLNFDASKTKDAEHNMLSCKWWIQPEATTYANPVEIDGRDAMKCKINVPNDASGRSIHLICEVHDDGPFHIVGYQRVIINIK